MRHTRAAAAETVRESFQSAGEVPADARHVSDSSAGKLKARGFLRASWSTANSREMRVFFSYQRYRVIARGSLGTDAFVVIALRNFLLFDWIFEWRRVSSVLFFLVWEIWNRVEYYCLWVMLLIVHDEWIMRIEVYENAIV